MNPKHSFTKDLIEDLDNKVAEAIELIQAYEPPEGFYLADSGGKDSDVVRDLVRRADVDYHAEHNLTGLAKKEQIIHINNNHPEVEYSTPEKDIRELVIENKYPPTRVARYCCRHLKERGGEGELKIMGIRAEESTVRYRKRDQIEYCATTDTKTINPIYDWTEDQVWQYIIENGLNYCDLYDQGYDRIGCTFCPFNNNQIRKKEAEEYPNLRKKMVSIFDDMIEARKDNDMDVSWKTGEEVLDWWLNG